MRGNAANPPEFRYQSATDPLPFSRDVGLSAYFEGGTESVVTNQPLCQLSYAGAISTGAHLAPTPTPS